MAENKRKLTRKLNWEFQSIYRWDGDVVVVLEDPNEPDRPTRLVLSPNEAQYLGSRLLMQAEQAFKGENQ